MSPVSPHPALPFAPSARWSYFLARLRLHHLSLPATVLFALFVRSAVSLGSYSGLGVHPTYGDFEVQRHWMEITLHLPTNRWYYYDLDYWGLDYPPLTAYISLLFGKIAHLIDPSWVALNYSRGIETIGNKTFMRWTVIATDCIFFFPSAYFFCKNFCGPDSVVKSTALMLILLQPGPILIDHGHFQYNGVMLGLALASINWIHNGRYVLASIAFCLSLGFKQMALYYAPVIFAFLLGQCLRRPNPAVLFAQLGVTVLAMFASLLAPWIFSAKDILQVFHRVFPFNRGLFEDKVANVWCSLNVLIKLRETFEQSQLLRLSFISTLISIIPVCIDLSRRPSPRGLLYAMASCSIGFFLFSFQVHEKSILIPALPVTLILATGDGMDATWGGWFINVASFSMYPLLKKDGLELQYFCCMALWNWIGGFWNGKSSPALFTYATRATYAVMAAIHLLDIFVPPPSRYPHLYVVMNCIFSAGMFGISYLYYIYRQIHVPSLVASADEKKKKRK